MSLPPLLLAALLCGVTLAAACDLAWRRIPNALVLAGLLLALPLQWCCTGAGGGLTWLTGALTGLALFLPLYLMRGMAAGDVKLLAMAGACAGPALTCRIALVTFLAGGVMALVMLVYQRRCRQALANLRLLLLGLWWWLAGATQTPPQLPAGSSVGGMPYGLAIAVATFFVVLG